MKTARSKWILYLYVSNEKCVNKICTVCWQCEKIIVITFQCKNLCKNSKIEKGQTIQRERYQQECKDFNQPKRIKGTKRKTAHWLHNLKWDPFDSTDWMHNVFFFSSSYVCSVLSHIYVCVCLCRCRMCSCRGQWSCCDVIWTMIKIVD